MPRNINCIYRTGVYKCKVKPILTWWGRFFTTSNKYETCVLLTDSQATCKDQKYWPKSPPPPAPPYPKSEVKCEIDRINNLAKALSKGVVKKSDIDMSFPGVPEDKASAIALTKELFEDWRDNHAPEFLKDLMKDNEFVFISAPIETSPFIDEEKAKAAEKVIEDMGLGLSYQEKLKRMEKSAVKPGMIVDMPAPLKRSWWTRLKEYALSPMRHPFGLPPETSDSSAEIIKELRAEISEYESLLVMQWSRMRKATKLWQEATGKTLTHPDLGDLLDWLIKRGDCAQPSGDESEEHH